MAMSRAAHRKAMAEASVGSVIAGRYRLESLLGVGGMAEVYKAEDLTTKKRVAVKLLRADIAKNPEAVARTKREGEVLSDLHNPAIVSVETWGELPDGTVFLVMELLEGETFGERMRRGTIDPTELAPIVAGVCAGLHAAHARGIIHRDLKPDNIFLCPTEHGLQVKLLDFGISKFYGHDRLTQTGEVLGTPRYMSPEQLGAEPDIDARVDVYALGVILYEALAGKPPFLASTPTDLIIAILHGKVAPLRSARPDAGAGVEAVVMRAMAKVREARFDTAMGLAEAYIDAVGGVAAVRGAQRRGMATRAMGGMKPGGSVPPPNDPPDTRTPAPRSQPDEVVGHLRIGTFSGLALEAPELEPKVRTAQLGESKGAPIPTDPGTPLPSRPTNDSWTMKATELPRTRSPEEHLATKDHAFSRDNTAAREHAPTHDHSSGVQRAVPKTRENQIVEAPIVVPSVPPEPRSLPPTTMMPSTPSIVAIAEPRPKSNVGKVLLVIAALLAGAASAAAVIAALHFYQVSRREEADAAPPPVVVRDEPPRVVAPAPDIVEPPEQAPVAEEEPAPEPPTKRRRVRREVSFPDLLPIATEDPIRQARRALREGDPQRCIEILDEAIRRGAPATALRRRGDCYEAAGQRENAVRDYQRFCRLMTDSPAISELRPLLESWGRSCP
jgi:serine/threonine protein kinase